MLAARKLGLSEAPVSILDHRSETRRRAYVLAYNRLSLSAGWNEELVAEKLAALESDGIELSLIGFSDAELESLLADDARCPDERSW